MDISGIGGTFPPQSVSEHREEPNVHMIINSLNNGVDNSCAIDKTELPPKSLEPPNPYQPPIKVTPPPPRFIQEKIPTTAPSIPFTVLGSGKFDLLLYCTSFRIFELHFILEMYFIEAIYSNIVGCYC